MDILNPGSLVWAQALPVRRSPRPLEEVKPLVRSQRRPAGFEGFEDDWGRIGPAFAREIIDLSSVDEPATVRDIIDLSADDETMSPGSNKILLEKQAIDLCCDDEASVSACKPSIEKDIIDLSSDDEVSAAENKKPSSKNQIIDLSSDDTPPPGNHKAAPVNDDRASTRSRPRESTTSFSPRRLIASSINGKRLDAIADSGASFNVISQELADALGLTIDQSYIRSVCLPSGTKIRTLGRTEGIFKFSGEEKSYTLLCVVLEKCIHPLVLGSHFLQVTQTLTKHTSRIHKVFSNILSLNFLGELECEQYLLGGYLNCQAADIVPDTGSDIMVMSLTFAKRLGLLIHDGPQHRTKVQLIDGSEVCTIGKVRGVKWQYQKWIDWSSHRLRKFGHEFHIIRHLPVDVIVGNEFIDEVGLFQNHSHRLVLRQPKEAHPGIYGIRLKGESLRAKKKQQLCNRSQISSAEIEESELQRRDAAEEDIEELLLTDVTAAEFKRLEEQERRRIQDERMSHYFETRLSSVPQTARPHKRGITNTGTSVYDMNMTQHQTEASYQTQSGLATGASFNVESDGPQTKRRRLDLPRWFSGRR